MGGRTALETLLTVGDPNPLQRQVKWCLVLVNIIGDVYGWLIHKLESVQNKDSQGIYIPAYYIMPG